MPIYEYKCESCGGNFEILQKMGGEEETSCPNCKSKNVKKLLSTFSANSNQPAATKQPASQKKSGGG